MNEENKPRVFVYGTLKPGGHYHNEYCGGFQFNLEEAWIRGQLFDFPQLGYPGAVEDKNHWTKGYVFSFAHQESEVLLKLDTLEGYDPKRPAHQNEYYRIKVPYYIYKGNPQSGVTWCYFMESDQIKSLGGIPLLEGEWTI